MGRRRRRVGPGVPVRRRRGAGRAGGGAGSARSGRTTARRRRQALLDFLAYVAERRAAHPGMHVYHYAAYEKTALLRLAGRHGVGEEDVDELLRDGVLVDLYPVVRGSAAGRQPLVLAEEARAAVHGRRARRATCRPPATRSSSTRRRAMCATPGGTASGRSGSPASPSTTRTTAARRCGLRDWLLARAAEAARPGRRARAPRAGRRRASGDVGECGRRARRPPPTTPRRSERAADDALADRLLAHAGGPTRPTGPPTSRPCAMLAAAIGYHRREDEAVLVGALRPAGQRPGRVDWTAGARFLVERADAGHRLARAAAGADAAAHAPARRAPRAGVVASRPAPTCAGLRPAGARRGRRARPRATRGSTERLPASWRSRRRARAPRRATSSSSTRAWARARPGTTPSRWRSPPAGRRTPDLSRRSAAGRAVAEPARRRAVAGAPDQPALDLLRRRPPRTTIGALPPGRRPRRHHRGAAGRAAAVDRSYLAVQGPPGTGKTYTGARVIAALVARGWKVGVVAQSHAVVENMLREVA